jgi:site-specific recombinase XerD
MGEARWQAIEDGEEIMKKIRGIFEKASGSGIWWVRYADTNGKIRREKVGRKSDALAFYQKRKTEVLQGAKLPENLRKRSVLFSELAADVLEYSRANKISFHQDELNTNKLLQVFADRPADSLTPQDIERFLVGREIKPATENRYCALLSLMYRKGIENGKVKANPARLVKRRIENNAKVRYLLPEEESRLRAQIMKDCGLHLPELEVSLHTGMRLAEQYHLQWNWIDLHTRVLTVPRSKHGELRHIVLNDRAVDALGVAREQTGDSPYVFLNHCGERLCGPREWFDDAIAGACIPNYTWHTNRHTFASRLVMAGVDLRTVQELLGHKSITTTLRYAHLAPTHQLAAVQRLCSVLSAQVNPISRPGPAIIGESWQPTEIAN